MGKVINLPFSSTGEMIVSSLKYHVQESSKSMYETKMTMIVRKFQKDDVGSYRCIAKNSLGEVDSSIRLYGEFKMHFSIVTRCCFSLPVSINSKFFKM